MANSEHYNILRNQEALWKRWRQANPKPRLMYIPQEELEKLEVEVFVWNYWRKNNPTVKPDLRGCYLNDTDLRHSNLEGVDLSSALLLRADLRATNLCKANLNQAQLRGANLDGAYLIETDLSEADLCETKLRVASFRKANLTKAMIGEGLREGNTVGGSHLAKLDFFQANLSGAYLRNADFYGSDLREASLINTAFIKADLTAADLSRADLNGAHLFGANLTRTNLSGANLRGADLRNAVLVETDLRNAQLEGCKVYGISAWNVELEGAEQSNLVITQGKEPVITVDSLEVAQFIYLLLNNRKLRDVINAIGKRAVLILGRFSERKEILNAIADALRDRGLLPIIFDFERSQERDFTETIKILAGMSLFVIADITNPKSSPLELQATIPDYMIPFAPILQEGESPFSMFVDLQNKFDWVLPVTIYDTLKTLIEGLDKAIVNPALRKKDELIERKAGQLKTKHIKDYLDEENS